MQAVATTKRAHARAIFKLGMPLILSNLAQYAIHMTDALMLGWYSVSALAAVTLAGTFFFLTFIVGSGFAQAITPLVAAAAESGDDQQVRRATRMGLWLSVIYGAVMMVPFFWAESFLIAIGQDPEVSALAQDYLYIVAFSMIPALLVMAFKSFLVALEHTAIILWSTIGTAILNGLLNYALIFGNWGAPELGIQGAAIASLSLTTLNVVVLLIYALVRTPQFRLLQNVFAPDKEVGFSQAATVRAGRALGRRDEAGLRRGGIIVIAMSAVLAVLTMIIFLAVPEPLVSVFIDPEEPARDAVLALGISFIAVAGLFQVVDALQVMALGLLRGVQDTQVPMIMAAFSYWVIGLPVSYVLAFPLGLDGVGIWLGLVVGLSIAAVLLLWRFWARSVRIG